MLFLQENNEVIGVSRDYQVILTGLSIDTIRWNNVAWVAQHGMINE